MRFLVIFSGLFLLLSSTCFSQGPDNKWEQIKSGENDAALNKLYRSTDEGFRKKVPITPTPDYKSNIKTLDDKETITKIEYLKLLNSIGLSQSSVSLSLEKLSAEVYASYPPGTMKTTMTFLPFTRMMMARLVKDKKAFITMMNSSNNKERVRNLILGIALIVFSLFFLRAWRKDYITIVDKFKNWVVSLVLFFFCSLILTCVLFVDESSIILNLILSSII